MHECNIHHIVLSSSCAVYGVPRVVPISEDNSVRAGESLRRHENGLQLMLRIVPPPQR